MQKMLLTAALALLLTSCVSAPRVTTNTNPAADFSGFATYNFMQPLSTDRSGVQTPLGATLVEAMSAEMANRGFKRSNNPDLLINFFVVIDERIEVRQVPTTGSFYGDRRDRYRTWPNYRTEVRQYTQGTLAVDMVDAAQNILAWEAVAQQRVGRSTTANGITQEQANEVMAHVMAEFPGRAN
jgi:hypothetical protein